MSSETYHYPELGYILFGIEKVLNGIALLVCIYILYISLKFKSQKDDLTAIIKRQLVISCIIHIIPYIFPPLKISTKKNHMTTLTHYVVYKCSLVLSQISV